MAASLKDIHKSGRTAVEPSKMIEMCLQYLGSKDSILELSQLFNVTASTFIECRCQVQETILHNL